MKKIEVFKNKEGSWTVIIPKEMASRRHTEGRYVRETYRMAMQLVRDLVGDKVYALKVEEREKRYLTRATA